MFGKTKYYISVLTILLFAMAIGVVSVREAAGLHEPGHPDPTLGGVDLTRSGFNIQSQDDPLWRDWRILSNTNDASGASISQCGCMLASLSSIMNYAVGGEQGNDLAGRPHFMMSFPPAP